MSLSTALTLNAILASIVVYGVLALLAHGVQAAARDGAQADQARWM